MSVRKLPDLGFWRALRVCLHPQHRAPDMIVLPPGLYEHVCPGCKATHVFRVAERPRWGGQSA